ncbi:MAG TPA: hypothetical protein DEQ43_06035 [Nocardioides bacterium]|nr:hypothetical protein [Nocardioides sp.]
MLPFDWPYWQYGETVWPCEDCRHWHLELFEHPEAGDLGAGVARRRLPHLGAGQPQQLAQVSRS